MVIPYSNALPLTKNKNKKKIGSLASLRGNKKGNEEGER